MTRAIGKRLLILFFLSGLILIIIGVTGWRLTWAEAAVKTLARDHDPVILTGAQTPGLVGAPVDDLFLYTFQSGVINGQIPVQVDELLANGSYVTTEDGLLDANDEIVFLAKDLGDRVPDFTVLTATLPISETWYEIEVTDPLSPTNKGWAYLIRSNTLTHPIIDYVDYDSSQRRITTNPNHYELRFALTTHPGLDYLTLNGNTTDILDRTKLRVYLTLFGTLTEIVTEESLGSPAPVLVKDGRVRVILTQRANDVLELASLSSTYQAFASTFRVTTVVSSSVTVNGARTSVDLDSVVSGLATFYNANTPAGVLIDGVPDSEIAETPLSRWTQVSHSTGRLVQVTETAAVGGGQKNFYRDNNSPESVENTGNNGSYGEAGYLFEGPINQTFTTQSGLFVLPPATTGPDNVGATYEAYFFHPLQVRANLFGTTTTFLPIIFKHH